MWLPGGASAFNAVIAAMFTTCVVPIAGFLVFQRSFLRGNGLGGAIKG